MQRRNLWQAFSFHILTRTKALETNLKDIYLRSGIKA